MKVLTTAALCVAALAAVSSAQARDKPGKIVAFGDSLLDTRVVCPILTVPQVYPGAARFGTCSNGRGTLEALALETDYSFSRADDYAVGGAGIDHFNVVNAIIPGVPGTQTQVEEFVASGSRIGADDLVIFSGGGNDRFQLLFDPRLSAATLTAETLAALRSNVAAVIGAGARDVVVFREAARGYPAGSRDDDFANALLQGLPGTLAGLSKPGARVRLLDFNAIVEGAVVNPRLYGFSASTPCVDDPACASAPVAQQDDRFLYDIHPTEAGHRLVARYIARLITSADGIPAQAETADDNVTQFAASLLRRIEDTRQARDPGWNLFLQGQYRNGSRGSRFTPDGGAVGFGYDSKGIFGGIERRMRNGLRAGVSAGYARTSSDLYGGFGGAKVRSYQFSGFGSIGGPAAFADALIGYARHDLDVRRAGVIDTLRADGTGHSWIATLRAGRLGEIGGVLVGPVGQLEYTSTALGGYAERGDAILAQIVRRQSIETLTSLAGAEARTRGSPDAISAWARISYAHEFLDDDRGVVTANVFAPELAIHSSVRGYGDRNYGIAETGVSGRIARRLTLQANGRASFARSRSTDYAVSAGFDVSL